MTTVQGAEEPAPHQAALDAQVPLLLCVESRPWVRAQLAEALRNAGFRVLEAVDAEEAAQLYAQIHPDLVVCEPDPYSHNVHSLQQRLSEAAAPATMPPLLLLSALGSVAGHEACIHQVGLALDAAAQQDRALQARIETLGLRQSGALGSHHLDGCGDADALMRRLQTAGAEGGSWRLVLAAPQNLYALRAQWSAHLADRALAQLAAALESLPGAHPGGACQLSGEVLGIPVCADPAQLREPLGRLCSFEVQADQQRRLPQPVTVVLTAPAAQRGTRQLLEDAALALHYARLDHLREPVMLDADTRERVQLQQFIEQRLPRALGNGELTMAFQPKIRLADGGLVGGEALVRWNSPEYGLVSPALFIPAAERLGLIQPVTDWCLQQVCAALSRLNQVQPGLSLAVNASGLDLRDGFVARVVGALAQAGANPQRLIVEVTETALVQDLGFAAELSAQLRASGVRVAVDDFGTGWSSLSYLRRLPLDTVKLDRSFVQGIAVNSVDRRVCEGIVLLAQALGLHTEAEGVESQADAVALREMGCEVAQGWLFGRPGSLDELLARAG